MKVTTKKNKEHNKRHPHDSANCLSKLFFAWVTPLFLKSFRRELKEDEIFDISSADSSALMTNLMKIEWKKEMTKSKPSLTSVIVSLFWKRYLFLGVLLLIENCINLAQPLIIWKLLLSVKTIQENAINSLLYSTLLIITVAIVILLRNPYYFYTLRMGMQVKVGISGLIYRKILKLNQKALSQTATGQIINLLSSDVQRFELGFPHLHYIWIGPLVTILAVIMMYFLSKEGGLVGMMIFFVLIPLQIALGSFYNAIRSKTSVITDDRIKVVSELVNGMRVVKMYCWEPMFIKVIGKLRRSFLFYGMLRKLTKAFWVALRFSGGRMITLALLTTIIFGRISLSSQSIWVSVIFINQIRSTIIDRLSLGVTHIVDLHVSVNRVQTFLTLSELDSDTDENSLPLVPSSQPRLNKNSNVKIKFDKVCASWNQKDFEKVTLNNISFTLKSPQICAVIGDVGSGKSSLLMAILRELPLSSGNINVFGSISYSSQQPWVFSGTIQENILFNIDLDQEALQEIIKLTTLNHDLDLMQKGILTAVGERGVSLSGGQKARLSLARAVYKNADIILLDDPLAAVDSHVGHKLFFDCIAGHLKDKLVLLVTHQIHLLEHVDRIIALKDGRLQDFGTLSEIKSRGLDVHSLLKDDTMAYNFELTNMLIHDSSFAGNSRNSDEFGNHNESNRAIGTSLHSNASYIFHSIPSKEIENGAGIALLNKNISNESLEGFSTGHVGFKTYWIYFTIGTSSLLILLVFILYAFTMTLYIFCDIWLSWWTQEMDKKMINSSDFYKDDKHFLYGMIILTCSNFVFGLISVLSIFMICISSSRVLHDKMLKSILNSPIRFFDITPAGRILNRFSKDISIIDDIMPVTIQDFILAASLVVFGVGLSVYKNYWCTIIIVPLFGLFWIMRRSYLNVARTIKRIEAVTRSPLFDHVSNTLQGLTTIRSSKSQSIFTSQFHKKQDRHSKAFFLYISGSRWFAFRLDEVCFVFIIAVTYSCLVLLYYRHITPSDFGLILMYIISLIGMTQWAVRQSTEVENQMISVERIYEYSQLPSERNTNAEEKIEIIPNWPTTGKIVFENVSLYYQKEGTLILNGVNLLIKDKEKIGIVGRSGAGKSSLIWALFRLVELPPSCGRILIDKQDISTVALRQLRNSIAVIPQDPVLFMGNIRHNLDPFVEFDDSIIWQVLDTVELKETINELPDKLYSAVSEGGSNLSVGQRQLLCMARALLKKTRIIVIDEATANVDPRTDQLIQRTLKATFEDYTVLTIAHRLNTIIDSDKVLVMRDGQVVEFAHPHILLRDQPLSVFTHLVQQTGLKEAIRLGKEAESNYYNKKLTH